MPTTAAPTNGGQALKRAIHAARGAAGITSDVELALRARVSYDTLMNWYSDRTTPRPSAIRQVATALGIPYDTLLAAYEGRPSAPEPLQDAIRELIAELRRSSELERRERAAQHAAMATLLRAIAASYRADPVDEPVANGSE